MSWMFGLIKKNDRFKFDITKIKTIHPKPTYSFNTNRFHFVAGGPESMCKSNFNENNSSEYFITLGLGISNDNKKFNYLNQTSWNNILKDENANLNSLNGHFVTILIKNNKIIIKNDQLGLRELYYLETDDYIGLSSRLDWLTKISDNSEINLESYSSFWNLINSFSKKSFIKGIEKLCAGGRVVIDENNNIEKKSNPWHPDFADDLPGYSTIEMLQDLTLFPIESNYNINLALSGGIDSRTLLSFLLSKDKSKWKTTTWGKQELPDAVIAKSLAKYYKFQHDTIYTNYPNLGNSIDNLYKYVSETYATLPAYTMKELGYYQMINSKSIFIDGGSGALLRRVIGNKLLFKGKKYIFEKDIKNVYKIMKKSNADIFNDDTKKLMLTFALESIDEMLTEMPAINSFGPDNWIDLMNIRYFKPLNGAIAQSRIDNYLMNYMPFAQPSLLKNIFSIDEKKRRSEALNKEILTKNKYLIECPIVKYETVIPFTLNLYSAYVKAMINRRIKRYPVPNMGSELLDILSEFVQDRINSKAVKEHPYYNYKKICFMTKEYYKGDKKFANQLNWWLSYDIWREIISEKSIM